MPLTLLDYGKANPFGEILGKPRWLAWPVNVYRVTLPRRLDDGERLNPFERVILKLMDAGCQPDAETLAQETCIPKDLVQCVLLRLRDRRYIDDYNQILAQQRHKWSDVAAEQMEFVTACVFRELVTGRILPNVHFLRDNPLKKKEDSDARYRRLRYVEAYRNCIPSPRDVIAALRGMQKRAGEFDIELRLPPIQQIRIAQDAEMYYLECPIAIQRSDGEFRIADPFGNGFSLVLEAAFRFLLENDGNIGQWLIKWKHKLSRTGPEEQPETGREPYEIDANRRRYPKLLANLRPDRLRQFRSIEQIHAAIEWALFYSCVQREYGRALRKLQLTVQSEHPSVLRKAAEGISLDWPQGGLFPIRDGKIRDFLEGKAEMATVLSLSLLMAEDDAFHPLRQIAAAHPDFIARLLKIKRERDEYGHGHGRVRVKDNELPDDAFMREVVTALLPSVRFSDAPAPAMPEGTVADALMDARTSIQDEFGFAVFNRLGTNLQDRLIQAERFWLSCKDGDDTRVFAWDLYAALQSIFRMFLSGKLPPDIKDSEYVATARKAADACGLGQLPACLSTVKRSAVRETLLGNDQTLQACVIAFLLVAPVEIVKAIGAAHPSFIPDVARVIEMRGHGNEPLPMSKDEIRSLRKAAYTTIKTLLEA